MYARNVIDILFSIRKHWIWMLRAGIFHSVMNLFVYEPFFPSIQRLAVTFSAERGSACIWLEVLYQMFPEMSTGLTNNANTHSPPMVFPPVYSRACCEAVWADEAFLPKKFFRKVRPFNLSATRLIRCRRNAMFRPR